MDWDWLKRLMPRGLYGRASLILVLPVVIVTTVVSVAFLQRHFDRVTRQMTASMSREVALLADLAAQAPDIATARSVTAPLGAALDLSVAVPAAAAVGDRRGVLDLTGRAVVDELRLLVPTVSAVDLSDSRRVTVTLASPHGPLAISFDRNRVSAANPHQLLVLMVLTALLASGIASIFLRNQLRPIRRLSRAAEAFGRGQHLPYKPAGALEIRSAGTAFLDMRARIERHIESRTLMLSGISHDLRTPLTRLRLGLSMLPTDAAPDPDDIAALERDTAEMTALLDAFLDLVRTEAQEAPATRQPARPFVESVVADALRAGLPVTLVENGDDGHAIAAFRPEALRRAVENLIGNAVRYGGRAVVRVTMTDRSWRIAVEDDGPGIPEALREEALRPFTRLDPARNQDQGSGVGLGLAIASDIARAHGGTLRLGSGQMGGLLAEIVLPR